MNKKQLETKVQKWRFLLKIKAWWVNNGDKILSIILWFVYIPMIIYEKIADRIKKNFQENRLKTKKWLDKVFPKIAAYYCTDISHILVILGRVTNCYGDFCTEDFRNRYAVGKRAAKYFELLSVQQREQMIIDYEIGGYKKMMLMNWQDWCKAERKFILPPNYNKDYDKGVVFYISDNYR